MNNSKTNGYISILLLLVVTIINFGIILISLSSIQTSMIIENNLYQTQSKYMAQSYLKFYEKEHMENNTLSNINLFTEFDHDMNYSIDSVVYDKVPSEKIIVNCTYENINSKASCIISKYNKLFFLENSIILYNNLKNSDKKAFDKFKEKSTNGIFNDDSEIIEIDSNSVILSNGTSLSLFEIEDGNLREIKNLKEYNNYEIKSFLEIGSETSQNPNVKIYGNIFLSGTINLNTNLTINGIIISDSGNINTNGYSCQINGIIIEIGQGGAFPNVNSKYSKKEINICIKRIECAKEKEVLNVKTNSDT